MSRDTNELSLNPLLVSKYNFGFYLKHRNSELGRTIGSSGPVLAWSADLQHLHKAHCLRMGNEETSLQMGLMTSHHGPLHSNFWKVLFNVEKCLPMTSTLSATVHLLMQLKVTLRVIPLIPHSLILEWQVSWAVDPKAKEIVKKSALLLLQSFSGYYILKEYIHLKDLAAGGSWVRSGKWHSFILEIGNCER